MKSLAILVLLIFGTSFATDQAAPASKQNRILWATPTMGTTTDLVGKTIDQAQIYLAQIPVIVDGQRIYTIRPVKVDGEELMVTEDYVLSRVNVELIYDIIVGIKSIG